MIYNVKCSEPTHSNKMIHFLRKVVHYTCLGSKVNKAYKTNLVYVNIKHSSHSTNCLTTFVFLLYIDRFGAVLSTFCICHSQHGINKQTYRVSQNILNFNNLSIKGANSIHMKRYVLRTKSSAQTGS